MAIAKKSGILLGYNQFLCAEALLEGSEFSLSLFEDLNKLIESIVLYDQVILLGDYSLPSGILAKPLDKEKALKTISDSEIKGLFLEKDVLDQFDFTMSEVFGKTSLDAFDARPEKLLELRISPNQFDKASYNALFNETANIKHDEIEPHHKLSIFLSQKIFQTRNRGGHFYYIARSIVYSIVAELKGWDYAPDLLRMPVAALAFSQSKRPLPRALYDAVVEKVESEIEALMILGMPVSIFVPPITAKILSTVDSQKHYVEEILKLRNKFAKFREAYSEFLTLLGDPNTSLKEKIEAKKKMLSRITGIIDKGESGHALNVKTVWDKLVSSSLDGDGLSTKLSLSGLASLLIDQFNNERAKGHAKALLDLWTDTMNIKNYGNLVQKAFNTQIDKKTIDYYKNYSNAIRTIVKSSNPTF